MFGMSDVLSSPPPLVISSAYCSLELHFYVFGSFGPFLRIMEHWFFVVRDGKGDRA